MPDQVISASSGFMAGTVFHETITASATLKAETRVVTINSSSATTTTFPAIPDAGVVLYITNVGTGTATLTAATGVTWDGSNQSITLYPGEHITVVSTSTTRYHLFRSGTARQVLTANGAITIPVSDAFSVVVLNKAGVLAATLAAPVTLTDDGKILIVTAATANAHTVTNTSPGFNNAGAGGDVGTFGGAVGDGFMCVAFGAIWNVISAKNVTFA